MKYLEILYPDAASGKKLFELIQQYQPTGIKIRDFEIAAIGMARGIQKIATFNRSDFKIIKNIEVIVPGEI